VQFYKVKASSETLNVVRNKNENNIPLTDNEAIDLLIVPDMTHDYNIRELLEMTSELIRNAKILDREFHCDLIDCQKKVMQRFIKKEERKEMENMLNLKAEDYGLEPNVTGFEEAVNLSYLDGKREGISEGKKDGKKEGIEDTAKNLIELGFEDEIISKATKLDLKTIKKLRNE
jgi:predicted transposase/invertase (TIGR01784 family)